MGFFRILLLFWYFLNNIDNELTWIIARVHVCFCYINHNRQCHLPCLISAMCQTKGRGKICGLLYIYFLAYPSLLSTVSVKVLLNIHMVLMGVILVWLYFVAPVGPVYLYYHILHPNAQVPSVNKSCRAKQTKKKRSRNRENIPLNIPHDTSLRKCNSSSFYKMYNPVSNFGRRY